MATGSSDLSNVKPDPVNLSQGERCVCCVDESHLPLFVHKHQSLAICSDPGIGLAMILQRFMRPEKWTSCREKSAILELIANLTTERIGDRSFSGLQLKKRAKILQQKKRRMTKGFLRIQFFGWTEGLQAPGVDREDWLNERKRHTETHALCLCCVCEKSRK